MKVPQNTWGLSQQLRYCDLATAACSSRHWAPKGPFASVFYGCSFSQVVDKYTHKAGRQLSPSVAVTTPSWTAESLMGSLPQGCLVLGRSREEVSSGDAGKNGALGKS